MRGPSEFDAFYTESRGRLLLQAYALTGDLRAARGAVVDAYVAAWHHWRKVAVLDDPESWVRPHAWRHAQRRHQAARLWHRSRILDDDARATLEALRRLSVPQRKMLLLTQLSELTTPQMAREVGLTDNRAAEELAAATAQLGEALAIGPEQLRPRLEALAAQLGDARFPEPEQLRSRGTRRRRLHAAGAVALGAATVLVTGLLVHTADGNPAVLGEQAPAPATAPAPARLVTGDLLTRSEVGGAFKRRKVTGEVDTDDNTSGDGRYVVCQGQPFAAPEGLGALVRRFDLTGKPAADALQVVEHATDPEAAADAYQVMETWFTGCEAPQVQLISTHRLEGLADQSLLLTLRSWSAPVTTHQVAVARTGSLLSLTLLNTAGKTDEVGPSVRLATDALARLCASKVAAESPGSCATGKVNPVRVAPPAVRRPYGMLQALDLPPMPGADLPWAGVKPTKATTNAAATPCDNTSFKKVPQARTRTFVIPGADLPTEFGITETIGQFRNAKAAKEFVRKVRSKMADCEENDLGSTVTRTSDHRGGGEELTTWLVESEVSENRSVIFRMGIMRRGTSVAQVGFTPGSRRDLAEGGFTALSVRAMRRLGSRPDA